MGDFPSQVQAIQSPAVAGDFCDANPRSTVDAGPGALVAGQGVINDVLVQGAVVGRFGWLSYERVDGDGAPAVVDTFGAGMPAGLVHRSQQGLITAYLAPAVEYLQRGFQIELFSIVGMWVVNAGATQALPGMKAFARYKDGAVLFAAAGASPGGGSSTASIAAATSSVTGSIVGNLMTVTAVGSGVVRPGTTISGTNVATGTKVVEQLLPLLSGEALGGIGRYSVNIPEQSVASTTISGTYGIMTAGTVTGAYNVGETISGTNVVAGTTITQQITGSPGAAGTYAVDNNTVVNLTTITSAESIETEWYCKSSGLAGEKVKIARVK